MNFFHLKQFLKEKINIPKQTIYKFKQAIKLRNKIVDIIYEQKDKEAFIAEMDKLIESKTNESRKQKITEYKAYILKHWK